MNVSTISSSSSIAYSSGTDSEVRQLQNQIKNLQKQITAEGQSKDDAKTKQTKVELLEAQIAQIEVHIQQIQAKKSSHNKNSHHVTTQVTSNSLYTNNKLDIQA